MCVCVCVGVSSCHRDPNSVSCHAFLSERWYSNIGAVVLSAFGPPAPLSLLTGPGVFVDHTLTTLCRCIRGRKNAVFVEYASRMVTDVIYG